MTRSIWPTVPYWLAYLLPPIIIVSVYNRGWYTAAPIVIIFGVLPLLDWLSGIPPIGREAPDLAFNNWFRVVTWAWVPVQLGLIAWLVRTVPMDQLTMPEMIAATVSVGATTGAIGMTFAHELIHRRKGYERLLGTVLLASVTYPHFAIEHVRGHHRHVGTPRDPATARLGENVYRFLRRSIMGGLRSAWHIERVRLWEREIGTWSRHNAMLRYLVAEIAIYASIAAASGPVALAMFAGQSLVAIIILEVINYVEHYGLVRRRAKETEYERVKPEHSWDAPNRVSNWLLINLPRHSDHHLQAAKRYQTLELLPHAPHLPGGYGAMFWLALIPPLWFRVMNRRVAAVRSGMAAVLAALLATATLSAAADLPSVLISRQLSEGEHIAVGDVVRLSAAADGAAVEEFRVAGIYEPTPNPARLGAVIREVQLHLPDLLNLTRDPGMPAGSEYVQTINVALVDPDDAQAFSRDVQARMPGVQAQPATGAAESTGPFIVLRRFHLAIAIVTIVASTVFLLALTIMLVDERRAAVGVLRLIGLPIRRILVQLFFEGVLIAAVGSLFGIVLSLLSEGLINRFFQWRYDTALIFVRVTPEVAAICVAIAVPLGVTATVVASWALLRRNGLRLARR